MYQERGTFWLFDAGEATQHQIMNSPVKPSKLEKLFITHLHGDHIFGIPGLLASRSFQGGTTPVTIYGPKGIRQYVETSIRISQTHLMFPIEIIEIEEGTVFEDEQFTVEALHVSHGIECFGFRITERDRKGHFMPVLLKPYDIEPGPLFGDLKAGKSVTLADGTVLHGQDFVGPDQKGRVITILGDTLVCDNAVKLAEHADVLVHEATFSDADHELAAAFNHTTSTEAANVAIKANVKTLILTHVSCRYQKEDTERILAEAKAVFPNVHIAYDFWYHTIPTPE